MRATFNQTERARLWERTLPTRGGRVAEVLGVDRLVGHVHTKPSTAIRRQPRGVHVRDSESGVQYTVRARCVVNAAGVWVDAVREMDRKPDAPTPRPWSRPARE